MMMTIVSVILSLWWMFIVVQDLPDHPEKHFAVITSVSMYIPTYVYAILLYIIMNTYTYLHNYCSFNQI